MADGSLSQFKATLARKKARKDKSKGKFDRKKLDFKDEDLKPEYNFPELSEDEMDSVKKEIRRKAKSERQIELVILGVLVVGILLLILYIN
ncbi:hypothetical protein [Flagellimonas sp.]|uniref:hypothetical protein n=1 Tax=Flagellimonas sp. TaxID=2058762 RepID=UPI003F4A168D